MWREAFQNTQQEARMKRKVIGNKENVEAYAKASGGAEAYIRELTSEEADAVSGGVVRPGRRRDVAGFFARNPRFHRTL